MTASASRMQPLGGDDEFMSLGDIVRAVFRGWLVVLLAVVIALAGAFGYLLVVTPKYDAVMVVAPSPNAPDNQQAPDGSLAKNLLFGQQQNDTFSRFLAGLNAPLLAQRIAADDSLLRMMFDDRWDLETNDWKPRGRVGTFLQSIIGVTRQARPTEADVLDYLANDVTNSQINDNQMYEIHLSNPDPETARELLARITSIADAIVREAFLQRALAQSAYLTRELEVATLSEQRQVLIGMLFQEEQKKMLAKVDLPFSIDVVSAPWVGDLPRTPKIAITLVLSVVLGMMVGIIIVVLRERGRRTARGLTA